MSDRKNNKISLEERASATYPLLKELFVVAPTEHVYSPACDAGVVPPELEIMQRVLLREGEASFFVVATVPLSDALPPLYF